MNILLCFWLSDILVSKYILWEFSGDIWQFGLRVIWSLSIAQYLKNTQRSLSIGVVYKYGLYRD